MAHWCLRSYGWRRNQRDLGCSVVAQGDKSRESIRKLRCPCAGQRHSRQIDGLDNGQRRKANRRRRAKVYRGIVSQRGMPAQQEHYSFGEGRLTRGTASGIRNRDRADYHRHAWSTRASAKWSTVLSRFIWTNIARPEMNSSSAMPHSSALAPFTSHCAMAANVRSSLTAYS
jgi:hypothetical protein